ncbi:uncharacterized protein LOC129753923 [Uranotaenia lowii]|uniref:uncharacterized protein LOC129753923 n=1 Tax=Uranotaenia lowii TaxID=190385 RepID=UPI00247A033F|nr:uncharacterized protein LOC129753923 [Uranotaenia lowii]
MKIARLVCWAVAVVGLLFGRATADWGLPAAVNGFTANIQSSISTGTAVVTSANASIVVNTNLDLLKVLPIVQVALGQLNEPLNWLFSVIVSASQDKTTRPATLFSNFSTLCTNTNAALLAANTTLTALNSTVKQAYYSQIIANIALLRQAVTTLSTDTAALGSAVVVAAAATYPYTSTNITLVITTSLQSAITTDLARIYSVLNTISSLLKSVISDRQLVIAYQATHNSTIASTTNTVYGAYSSYLSKLIAQQASIITSGNSTQASIRNSFSSILTNPAAFSNGNWLTSYLNVIFSYFDKVAAVYYSASNNTMAAHADFLNNTLLQLNRSLTDLSIQLTDVPITSANPNANPCINKYAPTFSSTANIQISRLTTCLTTESNDISTWGTTMTSIMSDIQKFAAYSAMFRFDLCTVANGNCTGLYLTSSVDTAMAELVKLKIDQLQESYLGQMTVLMYRVAYCYNAVYNDILDNINLMKQTFGICLYTGS